MQFKNYTYFVKLCRDLLLKNAQQKWVDKYEVEKNDMFISNEIIIEKDIMSNEPNDSLWSTYLEYEKLIKTELSSNHIDPHKVASCITLAILYIRPFKLPSDSIALTKQGRSNIETVNHKLLLNEIFAIHCGFRFLKFSLTMRCPDNEEAIKQLKLRHIVTVDRYDDKSQKTYIDYMTYYLRYIWEASPLLGFKLTDIRNLAGIFHHIDNYCYSEIESSSKIKLCPSCIAKLTNNTIDKTISTDNHILCKKCHQTMRQALNSTSN